MITAQVNGIHVEMKPGSTILQACQEAGVYVPTLCNHPDIPPAGKCGLCVVKVNGSNYVLSCSTKLTDGMVIDTKSPEVKDEAFEAFKKFKDMTMFPRTPEIEEVMNYFDPKCPKRGRKAEKTVSLEFDPKQCINCDRCVRRCADGQNIGALDENSHALSENTCISCGQCIQVCPTKALVERNSIPEVLKALAQGKILCLQTAPSVRVAAGECFGDPVGTVCTGKVIAAARQMGFKYVFDTNYGADITIVEEGTELIHRISNNGILPMFTSCCPAWVNFVEKIHPEIIPHLSTTKSPHMCAGAMIKTYFAERKSIDPKNIFTVSLMPCTAKKDECKRTQMLGDVDAVLTVREFGRMINDFEIDWDSLPNDEQFDSLLGESTGAAALFGVTGGVMEAALRYAHEEMTKTKLGNIEYTKWRGFDGIKTASTVIAGVEMKICVCNGIAAAREFIESGRYKDYHFIEVMSCPFGCIAGGGQPKLPSREHAKNRAAAIYNLDIQSNKPTSNDNTEIQQMYKTFLGKPGGHLAHELLHTHYEIQTTPLLEMMRNADNLPIVAYGSASGTASKFARQFAGYIGAVPIALNNLTIAKMKKINTVIIFCSTFGDGEFPANAEKFWETLSTTTESLKGVRFAVCALGSTMYPKFCFCGHALDHMMVEKGATRILSAIELDSNSVDKGDMKFEEWAPEVVQSLGYKMPEIVIEPAYQITVTKAPEDPIHTTPLKPIGFEYGIVLSSTILTPEGYSPAMHRYQIKLPKGMTYDAGDHVAILPQNDPKFAETSMEKIGLNPDDVVTVSTTLPEGMNTIPEKVTIRELFMQYLDLNGLPTRNLLRAFKQYTKDDMIRERLEKCLDPTERHFQDLLRDTNISEFMWEFGKGGYPPLDVLMTAIPLIQPRLYSIASAPSATSYSIDLVITDNIFGPHGDRNGLCTSYLRQFGLTRVPIHTQKGCFAYPKDPSAPIILTALGCGVAPMLSLIQHREQNEEKFGPAVFFFGCRNKNAYPILNSILDDYKANGSIQDLHVAYSRDGATKTYITDLMEQNMDEVWNYWKNPKTELYYCGPSRGIPDQIQQIIVQACMVKGNMSREDAEAFTKAHNIHIESF